MNATPRRPTTPRDLFLRIRLLGLLLAVRLLLRYVALPTLLTWLSPARLSSPTDPCTLDKAVQYTDSWLRHLPSSPPGPCLPRALTLYYLATRCGFPVQFHCGVRRRGTALQGHAWLSLHGKPFLEPDTSEGAYTITFAFPDQAPVHGP